VIVGLGESTHGAHEQFTLKHRIVRLLVEQLGFRSVAMEEDWATGIQLNRYVLTGQGDPTELVKGMGAPWSTGEVQAVLEWLRAWNTRHRDKVQFVGTTSSTPAPGSTTRSPATSSRPPPSGWRTWRSISR
jgi:erythromycin esterase